MSSKSRSFDAASIAPMPWKNGGGTTVELACWPVGAGMDAFDWRISIATIRQDGPFSAFIGVDRIILLMQGGGVHLRSTDGAVDHRLDARWQPYGFPGEAPIECRTLRGESRDFNVMWRRERMRAELCVVREAAELQSSPQGLAYVAKGAWIADGQQLSAGCGFWWTQEAALDLSPAGGESILLAAQFWPRR